MQMLCGALVRQVTAAFAYNARRENAPRIADQERVGFGYYSVRRRKEARSRSLSQWRTCARAGGAVTVKREPNVGP